MLIRLVFFGFQRGLRFVGLRLLVGILVVFLGNGDRVAVLVDDYLGVVNAEAIDGQRIAVGRCHEVAATLVIGR